MSSTQDQALLDLLKALKARGYGFITPTPSTHKYCGWDERVSNAENLRDVFGWSKRFKPDILDPDMLELMARAGVLREFEDGFFSQVRVSNLGDLLFLHSAYPTLQKDSVFFGPDSYRFAAFLNAVLPRLPTPARLVDIGAGTGVGGIVCGRRLPQARVTLTDINAAALRLARINAQFANIEVETVLTNALDEVDGPIDCIVANPPYIADRDRRAYRDGGAMHGGEVSLAWTQAAAARLGSGGALLLYTGSAIINGEDRLRGALLDALAGFAISYREIDPDVFGEELEREDYAGVERIAAIGLVAVKR